MSRKKHFTGIQRWQRCQRLWKLASDCGYTSLYPYKAMTIGTWVHQVFASHYKVGMDLGVALGDAYQQTREQLEVADIWSEVQDDVSNWFDLTKGMLKYYQWWQRYYRGLYGDNQLQFLFTEKYFEVEINGFEFAGTWDALVRYGGGLYVFETKTTADINRLIDGLYFDWQPRLYAIAAELVFDEPVRGVIYNIIKRADPWNIPLLKRTGLPSKSQATCAATTYRVYREVLKQCIAEQQLDRNKIFSEYMEVLDKLECQESHLVIRYPLSIHDKLKEYTMAQLPIIAEQMQHAAGSPVDLSLPSLSRYQCAGYAPCAYRGVCLGMDNGADWEEMLRQQFIKIDREEA